MNFLLSVFLSEAIMRKAKFNFTFTTRRPAKDGKNEMRVFYIRSNFQGNRAGEGKLVLEL